MRAMKKLSPTFSLFAVAGMSILCANDAVATATLGGVVSVVAGSGTCNNSKQVPLSTAQDSFLLSGATACSGGSASVDLRGDAATGSVGLRASSAGNGFGSSQAGAQVHLTDHWLLTPTAGTVAGTINIPVSIKLEGSIAPGAVFDTFGGLHYNLTISDLYTSPIPSAVFSALGNINSSGNFSQTFNGSVAFRYFGPGSLPMTAVVEMDLFLSSLFEGTVDFYNTASITLDLPPGFSAATSSGKSLVFAPVPEPEAYVMMLSGIGMLGFMARRRKLNLR
jgi:PEP-CTERM putative exosortase interaction domain